MSPRTLPFSLAGFGLALFSFAQSAAAHIQLMDPPPRYLLQGGETGIKSCPCGLGGSNRTCNLSTDASDADRSTRVTRAEAGSQITLRFVEFVDHSGTFRVAFDPEGADVADFNKNILVPMVVDPPGTTGKMWEIPVTLPNMTCTNCTLQLIQAMNGDTRNPVADPTNVSSYYACVDLELVAPGTMGGNDGEEDPMTDPPPASDPGNMGTNTMNGGTMNPGTGSAGSTGAANGNMGTNLGTVPMMGDSTPTTPAMTGTTNMATSTPTSGVGSLMPTMGMSTGTPYTGTPVMAGAASSDDSGGCSLTNSGVTSRSTGTSGYAALAVAGAFASLSARRRTR